MIRHFFLDKTNTIIEGSRKNMGLNPISSVAYGDGIMRSLLHFSVDEIAELINDKTFANIDKLRFNLKMTNCMGIDGVPYEKNLIHGAAGNTVRAGSFDLVLYKLPREFDAGRGFDFESDVWITQNMSYSENGSNWYFAKNGITWPVDDDKINLKDPDFNWGDVRKIDLNGGIWTNQNLIDEFTKYVHGEESIVVGAQHFDFGNENLNIDITDYVMECINTGINNGLCLAFTPLYENNKTNAQQYVGFFNDHTNTFFHPYVEAVYCDYIEDHRQTFTIGKENDIYLYVSDDGVATNLDDIPSCSINDIGFPVEQVTKGVYRARIDTNVLNMKANSIYYDKWSNLALNGVALDDVELEIATNNQTRKITVGSNSDLKKSYVPSIYGINNDEGLHRGEIREVTVDFREEYSQNIKELINSSRYKLYTEDGNRIIEILPYQPIEQNFLNNYFIIYTEDLIPGEYFIDIESKFGRETKYFKKILRFKIVSDVTERYE